MYTFTCDVRYTQGTYRASLKAVCLHKMYIYSCWIFIYPKDTCIHKHTLVTTFWVCNGAKRQPFVLRIQEKKAKRWIQHEEQDKHFSTKPSSVLHSSQIYIRISINMSICKVQYNTVTKSQTSPQRIIVWTCTNPTHPCIISKWKATRDIASSCETPFRHKVLWYSPPNPFETLSLYLPLASFIFIDTKRCSLSQIE